MASLKFFHDFSKGTDDFFKRDEYDLGRTIKVDAKWQDAKFCGELKATANPSGKVTAKLSPSFGKVEVTDCQKKGLKMKVEVEDFYKGWDLKSTHAVDNVETELKYKPKDSFWCTRLMSVYNPNLKGERVCKGRFSVALMDTKLKLAVGAQGEVVDKSQAGVCCKPNLRPSEYSMGFRYTPTDADEMSIIYKPDQDLGGSRYQFSALRQLDGCTLAVRAEGKADLMKTEHPPVVAIGGEWKTKSGKLQGFLNSKSEYGVSYKVDLGKRAELKLGYGSFYDDNASANVPVVGYKLCIE